ncbi:MAG: hypothetical protein KAJ39_09435 [Gammaproteobacteria bacterium]|nr:hypothetical protein [Gammaproteobacteria bacterium]
MIKNTIIQKACIYLPLFVGSLWIAIYGTPMMFSRIFILTPLMQYLIVVLLLIVGCEIIYKVTGFFDNKKVGTNEG